MMPKSEKAVRFQNVLPLPYTIDKTLTPALMYVFDQPLTEAEKRGKHVLA